MRDVVCSEGASFMLSHSGAVYTSCSEVANKPTIPKTELVNKELKSNTLQALESNCPGNDVFRSEFLRL